MLATSTLITTLASAQEKSPEFKMLDRLVGSWKFEFGEGPTRSTGEFKAEWILDGRFVQKKGFIKGPDGNVVKTTSLVTYLPDEKKFRTWSFMSNGTTNVGTATWDSKRKVLNETRKDDQFIVTTTTDWSRENEDTWTMVFKNKDSRKVMFQIKGKATKTGSSDSKKRR